MWNLRIFLKQTRLTSPQNDPPVGLCTVTKKQDHLALHSFLYYAIIFYVQNCRHKQAKMQMSEIKQLQKTSLLDAHYLASIWNVSSHRSLIIYLKFLNCWQVEKKKDFTFISSISSQKQPSPYNSNLVHITFERVISIMTSF